MGRETGGRASTARERARRRFLARGRRLVKAEAVYRERGIERLCGVDEAGVGPLAGPVAAAAVIMPVDAKPVPGVYDSKALTGAQRAGMAAEIRAQAVAFAVCLTRPRGIDRHNIYRATLLTMRRAVLRLAVVPEHVLVDARTIPALDIPQEGHVGGDGRFYHIACAAILAKTTRDAFMERMDERYPGYGFAQHKGYPSPEHRDAIRRLGPSPIHRASFRWLPEGDRAQQTLDKQQTLDDLWEEADRGYSPAIE